MRQTNIKCQFGNRDRLVLLIKVPFYSIINAIRDSVKTPAAHQDRISLLDNSVVQEAAQHSPLVRYLSEADHIRYLPARFTVKCEPYSDASNLDNGAGLQLMQIKSVKDNVLSEIARIQIEFCQRLSWYNQYLP